MDIFGWYIKSLANCKDGNTGNAKEMENNDEFRRAVVKGSIWKKYGCGTLYLTYMKGVFRKQVEFYEKVDTSFRLELGNGL